jgi:hypothetical protein
MTRLDARSTQQEQNNEIEKVWTFPKIANFLDFFLNLNGRSTVAAFCLYFANLSYKSYFKWTSAR